MRTLTAGEETILGSSPGSRETFTKVRIQNVDGTWKELTNLDGDGRVSSVEWTRSADHPVAQGVVLVHKDDLAPLDETSSLNVDDLGAYAALLDGARRLDIQTATVSKGSTPSAGDYHTVFDAVTRNVAWPGDFVRIDIRDRLEQYLQNLWIVDETTYGTTGGRALEDVLQDILNDHTDGRVTLWVPTATGQTVTPSPWKNIRVLEAMWRYAGWIGWTLRSAWNESAGEYQLLLSEPNRTATTTDWDFDLEDIAEYENVELDIAAIRNDVRVLYVDSNGDLQEVQETNSTSIDRYERQILVMEEGPDSPIDTNAEATALAQAALADRKDPDLTQRTRGTYFFPVEIGDYLGFAPDERWYSSGQNLGVFAITHRIGGKDTPRAAETSLDVRGKPAGMYSRWDAWSKDTSPPEYDDTVEETKAPRGAVAVDTSDTGAASALAVGGSRVQSWKVAAAIGSPPSDATVRAATAIDQQSITQADVGTLVTASPGERVYLGAFAYDQTGGGGRESARMDDTELFGVTNDGIDDRAVDSPKLALAGVERENLVNNVINDAYIEIIEDPATFGDRVISTRALFVGNFDNLIPNPGFEQDDTELVGWSTTDGGGTWSVDTTNPRSGGVAAKYDPAGQTSRARIFAQEAGSGPAGIMAATEGDRIYLECRTRKESSGTPNRTCVEIAWFDETGSTISRTDGSLSSPQGSWGTNSVVAVAPAGTVYARLHGRVEPDGNSEPVLFDDFYARRMIDTELYVDGSITAVKTNIGTLSELADDVGIVVDGELRNAAGTRYIDLSASGSEPFIRHENFVLRADGSAEFGGSLTAPTGTLGSLDILDDLFLASSKRIKYGTAASPTTITKTLRIACASFLPDRDSVEWIVNTDGAMEGRGTVDQERFVAALALPEGVTVTEVRTHGFSNDAGDRVTMELYKVAGNGVAPTLITSDDLTEGGGWQTNSSGALSETVGGDTYFLVLELSPDDNNADATALWVEVDYEVANLSQSL